MNERLSKFLRDLEDPTKYVKVKDVAVFDEHDDEYWINPKTGEPASKDTPGAKKIVQQFTKQRLQRIAHNNNRRDRGGTFAPLTIGHTIPGAKREEDQPDIVGVAKGYRVVYDPDLGRNVIQTTYYIRKEEYTRAAKYPRTSVEVWPGKPEEEIIDPVALIVRTPQRDLGQWHYSMSSNPNVHSAWTSLQGRVRLRYSMESNNMAARNGQSRRYEEPPPPPPAPDEGGMGNDPEQMSHHAKALHFAKHCLSHPYAKDLQAHFEAEEGDEHNPTEPPSATEEPMKMGAAAAGPGNGGLPGMDEEERHSYAHDEEEDGKESKKFQRNGTVKRGAREDAEAIRHAREQAAMKSEIATLKQKNAVSESRQIVTQLVAENFDIDAEAEVKEFSSLNDAGRSKREAWIRRYARTVPVGGGRVRLGEDDGDPGDDIKPRHHESALQYMREHGGSWEDAVSKTKGR